VALLAGCGSDGSSSTSAATAGSVSSGYTATLDVPV
jgi:hypothetical protein